MTRIQEFARKDGLYILLLIFVILMSILMIVAPDKEGKAGDGRAKKSIESLETKAAKDIQETILERRQKLEELLREKRHLALIFNLATLLILAVIALGSAIDAILLLSVLRRHKFDIATYDLKPVRWNMWDAAKVAILFLFFGYMVILIEAFLVKAFPLLKNDNFRTMLNSSVLDMFAVIFIIYFTVVQYSERLVSLGISLKNFARNVYYGIIGYVAAVPVLVATLLLTLFIASLVKYVPEEQPIVELYLKEDNILFLIYTSVFASVVGPVIEELFFRGFFYGAARKIIGVFWATMLTAALFAALHTNVAGFAPIMVLGILLTYLYEKTGTLVASVTVHIMHNMAMIFFVFLAKQVKV